MEFKNYTIGEFNKKYGLNIIETNDLENICQQLESEDIGVFYADGGEKSVLEAIEEEKETAEQFNLKYICLDGNFMAIYL